MGMENLKQKFPDNLHSLIDNMMPASLTYRSDNIVTYLYPAANRWFN
jgi:hypothetical protein